MIISDKKIKNDAEVTILGANSVSIKPHKDDYAYPPARLLAKYGQGLVVRGSFVIPLSAFRNTPNKQVIEPPYILVDGLAVPDLASVPTAEIDRMEYLSGAQAAVYGHQSVIRIFTKDKNATEQVTAQENGVGIQVKYSQGYDLPRVFYKPKYSYKEEYSSRNILTLDWEPTVKTDQYGNATISFYNANNDAGEITIIIEGMSEETPVYSKIRITNSNP